MSENQPSGPIMISATEILRPPPARLGRITKDIVLPRTVELRKVVAGGIGMFAGLFLWVFPVGLLFRYSLYSLMWAAILGACAAVLAVSWSPLKGESLATWIGLSVLSSRRDTVRIDGRKAKAYIGIAPLRFTAAGSTFVRPSCVVVPLDSVDERGVFHTISASRRLALEQFPVELRVPDQQDGFDVIKPLGGMDLDGAATRPKRRRKAASAGASAATQAPPQAPPQAPAWPDPKGPPVQSPSAPSPGGYADPFAQPAQQLPRR